MRRERIDRSKLYFLNDSTRGIALSNVPLNGQYKWMGGFIHNDVIYGVPHNATGVFKLDTTTEEVSVDDYGIDLSGDMKWWGAVVSSSNIAYCIPYRHNKMLVIDLNNQTASLEDYGIDFSQGFSYANAVIDSSDNIYFCPYNAKNVLIFDTVNNTHEYKTYGLRFEETNQYCDAVIKDDKIMMVPLWSNNFLIIDTISDTASYDNLTIPMLAKGNNYISATIGSDNTIYVCPLNNPRIARINTSITVGNISLAAFNGTSKFSKMVEMDDGSWWLIPYGSDLSLKLRPEFFNRTSRYNIDLLSEVLRKFSDNFKGNDNIPARDGLLKAINSLNPQEYTRDEINLISATTAYINDFIYGLKQVEDSWSDGFLASNGKVYCVPYNARGILILD